MKRPVTLENCNGTCCSQNPWGVCAHRYECAHHVERDRRETERQAWRDFVNGTTKTAPIQPLDRNIVNRRTR